MENVGEILGWLAGLAMVAAIVPHQVRMIRLLCLAAGILGTAHFALVDGIGAGFAVALAFTVLGAMRLYQLYQRARGGEMTSDEQELFNHVMQIEEPSQQRRLRDLMTWEDMPAGTRLIEQGRLDPPLIYIASGRAEIERDGEIVSECGSGEFLGEMTHISGGKASATVTVTQDMRVARMDRDALGQLAQSLPEVGKALDRAFNRSLAVKVMRMNKTSR